MTDQPTIVNHYHIAGDMIVSETCYPQDEGPTWETIHPNWEAEEAGRELNAQLLNGMFVSAHALVPSIALRTIDLSYDTLDMLDEARGLAYSLINAWPRTTPDLDDVRNGREGIEGKPVEPRAKLPPLRDELLELLQGKMPIKVHPDRLTDMVEAIVCLLRMRHTKRTMWVNLEADTAAAVAEIIAASPPGKITPTPDGDPLQRKAAHTRESHTVRTYANGRTYIKGMSLRKAIMRQVAPNDHFTREQAEDWLAAEGYARTSYSPAMTSLVDSLHCKVVQGNNPRTWQVLKAFGPDDL